MEQSFSEWKVAEIPGPGTGRGHIFRSYGLRRIPKAVRQQGMRTAHQEWPRVDGAVNQGRSIMAITRHRCALVGNGLQGFIKLGLPGSGHDGIDRVNLGKAPNSVCF